MAGYLVQAGATVLCPHGGEAIATAVNPRVLLGGAPSVLMATPCAISGCALPPPPAANGPCVAGHWLSGTTRVLSLGQPLVTQDSRSVCVPAGGAMQVVSTQSRVRAA